MFICINNSSWIAVGTKLNNAPREIFQFVSCNETTPLDSRWEKCKCIVIIIKECSWRNFLRTSWSSCIAKSLRKCAIGWSRIFRWYVTLSQFVHAYSKYTTETNKVMKRNIFVRKNLFEILANIFCWENSNVINNKT